MLAKEFGQYLQDLRLKANLSLRQVELKTGVSDSYLSQLENGKRGYPKPAILKKLAPVYKVSYQNLLKAAGIIESGEFVYTPPEDTSPLESVIREFRAMKKDEQYETIKKLFDLIAEDKPKKRK
jgi:transcriptional regulator with XRE-family HTH domain